MKHHDTTTEGRHAAVSIELHINFEVTRDREIDEYVSHCPALALYSQGDTERDAIDNIREAVTMFLRNCYERGTLNQVLQDCGFVIATETKHEHDYALMLEQGRMSDAETPAAIH